MNFKGSSIMGDNNQAAPISIVVGESLGNENIKEEVERQFKKIQVKNANSGPPFQEECKKPIVVPKKRKGRPPRVVPPKVPKEVSDDLPPLMVNQRQKRKRSNKFNTFLEVLKGEKDFYIDDDGVEEPKVKKRGGGRKKKNPVIIETSDPVKDDDLEENVCVIQVTDMDLQHGEDNSEDKDRLNLDDVVQEIFGMTNEAETSLIQDIERMEHDNSLIDVIDKMNEVQETSENNGIIDLKKIVSMTNLKYDVKTEPGINVESELPIDFVAEDIPSIEITEFKEDIVFSVPSVEMTITQSADNTLQAEISDPDELSAIVQENTLPTLKIKQESGMEETITEKRRYRCKLCSEVFFLIEEARAHAKEFHRGNKPKESVFECSECDRSFPTMVGRDRHHLHMHLKHKPVSCPDCFAMFNSFRPLERHLRHKHDQDPKLFCEMCDAEFVLGTSLERHKEIMHPVQVSSRNTGKLVNKNARTLVGNKSRQTKKLECPFCKEKFVSARSLKIHHRKKHNGKEYMCKYCKYKTECLSTMHRHMVKVHKALDMKLHNCQKCMAGYHDPRDLEEHYISVHHLESSLHCQHCGDKFACLEMLRFHRNSHRAFSCKLCHLGFMKEEALEDHIKTVHNCDPVGIAENGDPLKQAEAENNCGGEILPMEKKKKTTESKSSTASSKVLVITSDGSVQVKDEPKEVNSISSVPSDDITLHLHQTQEGVLEATDMFNPIKGQKVKDLPKKMHCIICNKYLTTKFLRTHMLSHKGSLPHKCQFCDKAYAQGTLLRKHMKNRHYEEFLKLGNKNPKKHKVACHFCQEVYDTIYLLEEHLWQHMDEKLLECKDCKIKFGMESNLREHYKSHFFKEAMPCPVCRREFKSIGFFNEHVEKCQQRWKCEHCGMECDSPDYYRKHQRSEHGGERVTRYQCNHCEKSFVERHRYVDHVITHSSEKAFSCHICEKQFKRQRPLNDHILRAHCDSMFMCSTGTCRKAFPTQQDLDVHKQKHRKDFPCTYCTQVYSSNEALMNHLMVNHSNTSHVCHICSQIFQKQASLKAHLVTHNTTTPHICLMDGCYKMFRSEALLRTHMVRRHRGTNYECSVCDRKFALETDHIKHMATHMGEVPVPCDKCGKSFQNEALLERHLLTHSQEKPYECALCHHTGTQHQQVARHIQEEHHFADVSPYLLVNRWRCSACGKLFVAHESLIKHLQEHSSQGTEAEGHPVKTRSTPSSVLELSAQSGIMDSTTATATFLEQLSSLSWQDLTPLLRLDVIPSDTEGQETTEVWQCPGCNEVAQTEDNMKDHLITSTQCQEAVILHLAYGFNNTQELEEEPSACNYNEVLDDKGSGTVLQLTDSSGGMQYVIVHEQEEDTSQEKLVDISKESHSDQEGVGGMQMLMSMEELLSQPANPNIQIIVEESAPLKQLLDEGVSEAGQSSQPDLPREESEPSAPLLNGSEVLLQTPDGQLVLQQTVGGVTQFQLVEGVATTEQGEEPQPPSLLTTHSSAFHPEFLLPD